MIFCLGLHKTGTSSLGTALNMLGYTLEQDVDVRGKTDDEILQVVTQQSHVSRRGFPFLAFPNTLHELYPDAKFILTVRDEDSWYQSVLKNFGDTKFASHIWFYGTDNATDEETYRRKFREHNKAVCALPFVLTMNIFNGDGWEKLCQYLDKPIPNEPFPWTNKTKED